MRRVIVSEFVSLEGVIEDPGGAGESDRGGWSFQVDRGAEGDQFKFDELAAADTLLLERVTCEGFAAAWPKIEEQTGEYGAWMNGYPKHVVSRTLQEPLEWNNSTLIEGDVAEEVERLKQQDGQGHPRLRQRAAGKDADGARPGGRVPPDALPGGRWERQAPLRGRGGDEDYAACGHEAGRSGRCPYPHLRAGSRRGIRRLSVE
jgi:dihydrofolate reductase